MSAKDTVVLGVDIGDAADAIAYSLVGLGKSLAGLGSPFAVAATQVTTAFAARTPEPEPPLLMPENDRYIAGRPAVGKGYALLKCGDTEVVIHYSLLSNIMHSQPRNSLLQQAMKAIIEEAKQGHTGDDDPRTLRGMVKKVLKRPPCEECGSLETCTHSTQNVP
jgi:hypothetical protein